MSDCRIEGCDRDHFALGLCHNHYTAEARHERFRLAQKYKALLAERGETWERDPAIGPPGVGCRIDGCERLHESGGLCKKHYRSAIRRETSRLAREYRALQATEEESP